jgi:hypothetical protein
MATYSLNTTTTEEKLVWYGMVLTYPFFAFGSLYVTGSILGWLIFAMAMLRWYINGKEQQAAIPLIIWLWIIAGAVLLITLLIAHVNWNLGVAKTIKSSVGWAKGWALMPLFILLGAIVHIRSHLIVRAACILACHSLVFAIISLACYFIGVPGDLFISPLEIIGGPGADFFKVSLYGSNPETGVGRWRFFAPWAPAAGFMACILLIFCAQEKSHFWRYFGIAGSLAMCLLSQSRAGWVIFIMLIPMLFFIDKVKSPLALVFIGVVICCLILVSEHILEWLNSTYLDIKAARPDSTRVRSTLANIALQRWESVAPIWGHGIVERGPKIVEYMPIGTHHSWYGLLFVKGIVGLLALAIPMLITALYLLSQSRTSQLSYSAFCMFLVFIFYSFFENLEILAFIYWPALLWIGMALNPLKSQIRHV